MKAFTILAALLLAASTTSLAQNSSPLYLHWQNKQPLLWQKYEHITPIDSQYAIGHQQSRVGLLDISGKVHLPPTYRSLNPIPKTELLSATTTAGVSGILTNTGAVIVPFAYDFTGYSDSLLYAAQNGQYRWFDLNGTPVALVANLPEGVSLGHDRDDRYHVATSDFTFWGLVDRQGKWVVEPEFTYMSSIPDAKGYWRGHAGNNKYLLRPQTGWRSQQVYYEFKCITESGFWANKSYSTPYRFYDWQEREIPEKGQFDRLDYGGPKHYVAIRNNKKGLVLKHDLSVVLPIQYEYCSFFYRNYAATHPTLLAVGDPDKVGLFDGEQWLTPQTFNRFNQLEGGYMVGIGRDSAFVYSTEGQLVAQLDAPNASTEGAWVYSRTLDDRRTWHSKEGWVDLGGPASNIQHNGDWLWVIRPDRTYDLMDAKGKKWLTGCNSIGHSSYFFYQKPFVFIYEKADQRKGWIHLTTGYVSPAEYETVKQLRYGCFLVQKNLRWGIVDHKNTVLVPIVYDDASINEASSNLVALRKGEDWSCFTAKGTPFLSITFKNVHYDEHFLWGETNTGWQAYRLTDGQPVLPAPERLQPPLQSGHILTRQGGKYGTYGADGQIVQPFVWDTLVTSDLNWGLRNGNLHLFSSQHPEIVLPGRAVVRLRQNIYAVQRQDGLWQPIRANGQPLFNRTFKAIKPYSNGDALLFLGNNQGDEWEWMDIKGTVLTKQMANDIRYLSNQQFDLTYKGKKFLYDLPSGRLIPHNFDRYERMLDGNYIVTQGKLKGLADADLKLILPCKYQMLQQFINGYIETRRDQYVGLYTTAGQVCIPEDVYSDTYVSRLTMDIASVKKDKKVGIYIFSQQKWIPPTQLEDIRSCSVRIPLGKSLFLTRVNGLYGLMDEDCRDVLPPNFDEIKDIGGNMLICIKDKKQRLYNPVSGTFTTGEFETIAPRRNYFLCSNGIRRTLYRGADVLYEGDLYEVHWATENRLIFKPKSNDHWGLMDAEGRHLIPPQYNGIELVGEDLYAVQSNKIGLMNGKGEWMQPMTLDYYERQDQFIELIKDKKRGLANSKGQMVLPIQFDRIKIREDRLQFLAYSKGKCQFYNAAGQLLHPTQWDDADMYAYGLAAVKVGNLWGYINLEGTVAIPVQYRFADRFREQYGKRFAKVMQHQTMSSIGTDGRPMEGINEEPYNVFHNPIDLSTTAAYKAQPFYYESYAIYNHYFVSLQSNESKKGIVNVLGEWTLPPEYSELAIAEANLHTEPLLVIAFAKKGDKWGFVGPNGTLLLAPQYEEVEQVGNNQFKVWVNGQQQLVDSQGKAITK